MENRVNKYADIENKKTVDLDYEKEYHRVNALLQETRLMYEDRMTQSNEEWMKRMAEQDERRVREIQELKKELKYNKNIIKSVLHIRED